MTNPRERIEADLRAKLAGEINLHRYVPRNRPDLDGLCEDDNCLWWDMTYALQDSIVRGEGT